VVPQSYRVIGAYGNHYPGFGPAHWTDKDHYVRNGFRVPTDPPLPEWVLPRRQQLGRHIARQRHAAGLTVAHLLDDGPAAGAGEPGGGA
jgi:hypothetical protein